MYLWAPTLICENAAMGFWNCQLTPPSFEIKIIYVCVSLVIGYWSEWPEGPQCEMWFSRQSLFLAILCLSLFFSLQSWLCFPGFPPPGAGRSTRRWIQQELNSVSFNFYFLLLGTLWQKQQALMSWFWSHKTTVRTINSTSNIEVNKTEDVLFFT